MHSRYLVTNVDEIPSPSLLIYRDLVRSNIDQMLDIAGGPDRLRPHVKTHKMPRIVQMELEAGITKHKCATLAEARMLAESGVPDVFIAYQMVGPNIGRLIELIRRFPNTTFRPMVDHPAPATALSDAASRASLVVEALLDLDIGQHRTGIAPGPDAVSLYALLDRLPGLRPGGLHAYDGHNHQTDPDERARAAAGCLEQVKDLQQRVEAMGLPVPRRVMGGTPTFPCYARVEGVETSPGTSVLQDAGYQRRFPDLPFVPAALLLSRIVSIPTTTRATLDLGYKAIASDPSGPRGIIWNLDEATLVAQNEEHWIIEMPDTASLQHGQAVYVFPTHICPTCALHRQGYVIDSHGRCVDRWQVTARDRE